MVSAKLRAQALPPKEKKKGTPRPPETDDEFLAAGVEEEEGGEKWRAGDIVKSSRFFTRALGHYAQGLARFPQSYDLAYNRARLMYNICQQPKLLVAYKTANDISLTDVELLQLSLDWHEYALNLRKDDADLTFNIAQLLQDMAEREMEASAGDSAPALQLLRRALSAFIMCGELQHAAKKRQEENSIPLDPAADQETEMQDEQDDSGGVSLPTSAPAEDDRWATVVEPVTAAGIYDTIVAVLECLTVTIPFASDHGEPVDDLTQRGEGMLASLEQAAQEAQAIEDWPLQHPVQERRLVVANFTAVGKDAACRTGALRPDEYSDAITALFTIEHPGPKWLADKADADSSVETTLGLLARTASAPDLSRLNALRWTHLTRELASLTALSKLPAESSSQISLSLAEVHARRAECELRRRRLKDAGGSEADVRDRSMLASNAETFFRGAGKYAELQGGRGAKALGIRAAVASALARGGAGAEAARAVGVFSPAELRAVLAEMAKEELVDEAEAMALGAP